MSGFPPRQESGNGDQTPSLKLLNGQLAIVLLVLGGLGLCYLSFSSRSFQDALLILGWVIAFIAFGLWSRTNARPAFLATLILYLVNVIVKDLIIGGDYLLPFLFHLYFVASMIIGIRSGTSIKPTGVD